MSIWAIARITILRLGKPHGPILALLLLINTSNYKTGGGSFLFRPCPSRVARWKLDYIWEAVRLPSSNRINAPVYRGIFLFFAVSTAVDNDVGVEPTRRSNGRRWRSTISPLRVVPEARPPLGFTKFNSTVRKAAGWSNFALPPPRNCRLTNILQRKLRKLHEERDQTVNCLDFYVTA